MIITLGLRVAQLLLSAVILAISSVLISNFGLGHNPSLIDYGAACGGGGLVIAAVGVLALFFEPIQGIIMLCLDALASFLLLAGGLAFAVQAQTGSCTDQLYIGTHKLFLPSLYKWDPTSKNYEKDLIYDVENRCRMVQATTAFVWITFGCFLVTVALGVKGKTTKRGGAMV